MPDHLSMNDEQFEIRCEQEAILLAIGTANLPLEEQRKKKKKKIVLADIFDLNIVATFDKHKKEYDFLGHSTSISDAMVVLKSRK